MNINTLTVSPTEAEHKLGAARSLTAKQRVDEDDRYRRFYKAVRGGARVVDLHAAFRQTGLNDAGEPKLAIARADWAVGVENRGVVDYDHQTNFAVADHPFVALVRRR